MFQTINMKAEKTSDVLTKTKKKREKERENILSVHSRIFKWGHFQKINPLQHHYINIF